MPKALGDIYFSDSIIKKYRLFADKNPRRNPLPGEYSRVRLRLQRLTLGCRNDNNRPRELELSVGSLCDLGAGLTVDADGYVALSVTPEACAILGIPFPQDESDAQG